MKPLYDGVVNWQTGVVNWQTGVVVDWQTGVVADWQTGVVANWQTGVVVNWQTVALSQGYQTVRNKMLVSSCMAINLQYKSWSNQTH
jgi:hypothetical protein